MISSPVASRPSFLQRLFTRRHSVGGADLLRADGTIEPIRSLYTSTGQFGRDLLSGLQSSYDYSNLTVANAFAVSVTAWACANVRSSATANIPLMITTGKDRVETETPAQWFIEHQMRLLARLSFHLSIFGRFYLRKRRTGQGLPTQLELLNPLDVTPQTDPITGKAMYYQVVGRSQPVKPCDMITDTTFNPLSDVDGVSSYEVAMRQILADAQLIRYAGSFFANGARIDGILAYEGEMSPDEYNLQVDRLKAFKGAANAFKIFLTGGLFKWSWMPVAHAPADLAMPDLKNLLRSDTCAAFRVNPVLIGIGTANDPLSALGTYKEIRTTFTEEEAIPELKFICSALNEQWIRPDFPIWGPLTIEPDLKEFLGATTATQERSSTAIGNVSGGIWGVNEARKYTGQDPWQGHIERDPGRALALWQAGVIKRSRAQVAIGETPDVGADGYIYELDPRAKGQPTQAMNFSFPPHVSPSPAGPSLPEPPRTLLASSTPAEAKVIPLPTRSEGACYVILSLASDPMLTVIQDQLRLERPDIDWEEPSDFHVTLVYAQTAPDLDVVRNVLPKSINPFRVSIAGLGTFESEDKIPLYLSVQPDTALIALQSGLAGAFTALGATLSEYSDPMAWQPHITLGYLQPGQIPPVWNGAATVTSASIICSIEQGDDFETVYVTRSKEAVALEVAELEQWRKKVASKGTDVEFEVRHISGYIAEYVQTNLTEEWNPAAIFANAKAAVRASIYPAPMGVTPEEAQSYWRDFDQLKQDMGAVWLDYQRAVSDAAYAGLLDNPREFDLGQVMEAHHETLLASWIGTPDQPGDLYKIMLAGMQAGQRSLEKEVAANPQKPRAANLLVSVEWDLASQEALDFIRTYALNLIRRIDDTTRENIRAAVAKYIDEGLPRDWLQEQIANTLIPPGGTLTEAIRNRALLIGDNESMLAYNEGALNRWESAGVQEGTWETVNDGKVCPICRRLAGQVASIRSGWRDPATGEVYRTQAHVRDRCFRRPRIA